MGEATGERRSANGDAPDLATRTKQFALRAIRLCNALPKNPAGRVISNQLLRSATSVGANYRAARRGRSKAEFMAKLGLVEEEADESCYWLELVIEANLLPEKKVTALHDECNQILAMVVASRKTGKSRKH